MKTEQPRTVLVKRYALEEEIGRGGLGSVWRSADRVLDRTVAVKVLHPHLAGDPAFAERFAAEARAAAGLSHPGIVRVLDTGTDGEITFIVTEYVDGESLRQLLAREGPLDPARAASLFVSVLSAVGAAHRSGVLHLDLGPGNILIGDDGRVRIADAGLAAAAYARRDPADAARMLAGGRYAAPELPRGEPVDERTDVFAAGAVLHESLTGRAPRDTTDELHVRGTRDEGAPIPPRAIRAGIPKALDAAVIRALAARPEERFATASDFAAALPSRETELPHVRSELGDRPASEGPSLVPAESSFFRRWMVVPILISLVVAALISAGLWLGRLQLGGPLGIEPKGAASPRPKPVSLPVRAVTSYDPFGDFHEHDDAVQLASDGNPATVWESENYIDGRLNKPGVGLLFDLGAERTVTGFRLETPAPGFLFTVLVGDDPATLTQQAGSMLTASADMRGTIAPVLGRYVLLWITSVVPTEGGAHRAEVAEFTVLGPGG